MLTPVTSSKHIAMLYCCGQQQQSQKSAFVLHCLPFRHAAAMYTALSAVCLKQHVQHYTHELLYIDMASVLHNRGLSRAGHVSYKQHRATVQTQHEPWFHSSKHDIAMEVRAVEGSTATQHMSQCSDV